MNDPAQEWQRLCMLYGGMSDRELEELAVAFGDLTDMAQDALREEFRRRRLGDPQLHTNQVQDEDAEQDIGEELPWILQEDGPGRLNELKTVLEEAGIKSEIVAPQENVYRTSLLQLQVAQADAEKAEAILADRNLLLTVKNQEEESIEDFQPPTCKHCGAPDPLLESFEPSNTWKCEECGARWSEALPQTE